MSEKRTTARAFHDAAGVEDWRVLFSGAHAYFRVGSFAEAARFVAAIAEVAEAVGHFPDVDVRPEGVTVRTASGEYGALSHRDVELARRISAEARKLGLEPDPSQVQVVGIAVAQDADTDVAPFWAAALGYRSLGPKRGRRRSAPAKPARVVPGSPPSKAGSWPDPHRRQRAGRSGRSTGRGGTRRWRTPGGRHACAPVVDARFAREPQGRHRGLAGLRGRRGLMAAPSLRLRCAVPLSTPA